MSGAASSIELRERAAIGNADPRLLEGRLSGLVRMRTRSGAWLRAGSRFANEQVERKLSLESLQGQAKEDFLDYLAASVPLHTSDAWTYIGRGLTALAHGSLPLAQHLFYYGELRAALAILSRHGIYCINGTNFVIDALGRFSRLSKEGTHVAAWKYLRDWSETAAARDTVLEAVRVADSNLGEWLDSRRGLAGPTFVIPKLFRAWGMDLSAYARDQKWRNHNSYSPQYLQPTSYRHSSSWLAEVMHEVWPLLATDGISTFGGLDIWLTRQAIRESYVTHNGKPALGVAFSRAVDSTAADILAPEVKDRVLEAFISPRLVPGILRYASIRPNVRLPMHISTLGMLGRALVLVRLAAAVTGSFFEAGAVALTDRVAWSGDLFLRLGLVVGVDPQEFLDTMADVQAALDDLETPPPSERIAELSHRNVAWLGSYQQLAKIERALVWSLVA